MKNKYVFTVVMLLVIMFAGMGLTSAYVNHEGGGTKDFKVVTSFYPMYIAAKNVIGDCSGVTLQNLSEPQTGCMHDYQLTAGDMVSLSSADVFVINGGGMESFLPEVAKQYPHLTVIDTCRQIELAGDNAHVWMSISDYMVQVQTIAQGLAAKDPAHEEVYQKQCTQYLKKLEGLQRKQQEIQKEGRACNVVLFHEAFEYIARDYGLTVAGSMDLDEERQVSAGEAADMVSQIKEHEVKMILAEELYGKDMCETMQKETDVFAVYLNTCVRGDDDADSYLNAMEENLELMHQALVQ